MQNIRQPGNRPQPPGGGGALRRPARVSAGIIAVALAVVGALLASAPAQATAAPAVARHKITISEKATLAYWTRARMRAATPAPLIERTGRPAPEPVHPGTPGHVPGGRPAIKPAARTATPDGFPYDSFNVPASEYTQWPYEVNGKVFSTFEVPSAAGGTKTLSAQCSGTSVASYHGPRLEDEVWTAGHCLADPEGLYPGVWASSVLFVPAYNGTDPLFDPFGEFVATWLSSTSRWLDDGDVSVDEGAFEVGANASGQTLGQAAGWDGFAWNWPAQQNFTAFGYPVAPPYTGNLMVEDIASTGGTSAWPGGAGQPMIGIGNPMTPGSSGGAWNINLAGVGPYTGPYIDGHTDLGYTSQPDVIYSPYQDSLANAVRCFGLHNAAAAC